MPDRTEIVNQFGSLGIEVNEEVLDLCESLCSKYSLNEETLVETWVAYSFNFLSGAEPTKERIIEWENKELCRLKLNTPKATDKIKVFSSSKNESIPAAVPSDKTPESTAGYKGNVCSIANQSYIFSPASFSPDVFSPSVKYNSRSNTRQSIVSYGNSSTKWSSSQHKSNIEVKEYIPMNIEWKYLHNTLRDISLIILDSCEELADYIVHKNSLPDPTALSPNVLEKSIFVGRVCAFDKSKSFKVPFQGLFESSGRKVELDLTEVTEYALFPGQVIAVEGSIISNKLLASKIYSSAMLPLSTAPTLTDTIQIVVAAGPFTLCDTLSYQPLHDLVQYVKENQPNILFLIGPLIDANHSNICDGNIAESFFDYYNRLVTNLIDSLKGVPTKLFIISSNKEAVSIPAYPTSPLCTGASLRNVKFYPDPSLLTIGGVVIGLTATDTIYHIGKYEISNSKLNRLARLGSHMLHQQSFYPLYPAEPDVGLDVNLWYKCARLPVTPHILVAPSNLNSFVKDVNGCLIINPERLVKGMIGGTFTCIEARPAADNEEWSTATHISAKIVKI
ncbi:hypothetical protein O3M35_007683 [Rhynocoris fuscipes]|uniref:DNA polymerase alpha subunit B n=1 Tax=Rhynocoris fuscipes TaxID=488301 RepID=A0AAW1DCV3_9HEMI